MEKVVRKIGIAVACIIAVFVFMYAVFSFVAQSFSPASWAVEVRVAYVFVSIFTSFFLMLAIFDEIEKHENKEQ